MAVDVDVSVGGEGEFVLAPCNVVIYMDIAVSTTSTTCTLYGKVSVIQTIGNGGSRHVPTACRNGKIRRVNQPCTCLSIGCLGGDFCIVPYLHSRSASFYEATIALIFVFGIDRTVDVGCALLHIGDEEYLSVFSLERRVSFDDACMVDDSFA